MNSEDQKTPFLQNSSKQMDALLDDAHDALSELLSDDFNDLMTIRDDSVLCPVVSVQTASIDSEEDVTSSPDSSPSDSDTIDIELCRLTLDSNRLGQVKEGTIFSLGKSPSPVVALMRGNRRIADGFILVRDGELCVRLQKVYPQDKLGSLGTSRVE